MNLDHLKFYLLLAIMIASVWFVVFHFEMVPAYSRDPVPVEFNPELP